jgi:radical SAM protein with 4Fe4S-binding SPASM domain
MIQFHPTNKCNLNCIFCGVPRFSSEICDKKWMEITSEACELRPENITISGGGEPMMRAKLVMRMMEKIKEYGISGNLITNGTLFTKDRILKIVSFEWDEICVSLHGSSQKLDNFIRGGNGFEKSIDTLGKFVKYKRKYQSKKPSISLWFVITKFNYRDIENFVKLGIKLGVDTINFRMVQGSGYKTLLPTNAQLYKIEKNLKEIRKKFSSIKIETMFSFEHKVCDGNNFTCLVPFHEMVIFADGRVSPCCNFIGVDDNNIVDNIMNKHLIEIWNGKIFNRFRGGKALNNEVCKICSFDMKFVNAMYEKG